MSGNVMYVTDLSELRSLTGMMAGQATQMVETGRAGLFRWDSSDLAAEVGGDSQMGIYVPPTGQDGSQGAWVRQYGQTVQINPYVEVPWFGAVGDGFTDDSAAFVAARGDINSPRAIQVGAPDVHYVLANFQMGAGCILRGLGKEVSRIVGNGSHPVILFGDGVNGSLRDSEMYDVRVENDGASCIVGRLSPNWKIRRCYIKSASGDGTFNTVQFNLSVRGDFSENEGGITGAGWGLALRDNCNGQTIHHNQWSGGSGGGAITAGICQGLSIKHNIIESSLDGIYVASTSDTGDGNCNGVEIDNNYIEQCRNPFVLGTVFSIIGWSLRNNYVGNQNQSVIFTRDATFKLGRLRHGEISGNSVSLAGDGSENLFEFRVQLANSIYGNVYRRGNVTGTAASEMLLSGDLASNASALRNLGGQNYFDFIGHLSSVEAREYVSDTIFADTGKESYAWMHGVIPIYGGQLVSMEIIEAQGDLTGTGLIIGDTSLSDRAYRNNDLATLIYSDGYADLPLGTSLLFGQSSEGINNTFRVIAGTGTGTFRVRIRYRAT